MVLQRLCHFDMACGGFVLALLQQFVQGLFGDVSSFPQRAAFRPKEMRVWWSRYVEHKQYVSTCVVTSAVNLGVVATKIFFRAVCYTLWLIALPLRARIWRRFALRQSKRLPLPSSTFVRGTCRRLFGWSWTQNKGLLRWPFRRSSIEVVFLVVHSLIIIRRRGHRRLAHSRNNCYGFVFLLFCSID